MIKAVIFDMDGVIVDSEPIFENYVVGYFKKMKLEIKQDDLKKLRGHSSLAIWTLFKDLYSLPNTIDFYVQDVRYKYIDHLKQCTTLKPIDGVVELLNYLKQNKLLIALATSGSKPRMETILDLFKLRDYFDVCVCAHDVKNAKPEPDLFLLAAEKLNLKPEECIVIEDSFNGVTSAKRAGMKCIGFKQEQNEQELSAVDYIVNKFDINIITSFLEQ